MTEFDSTTKHQPLFTLPTLSSLIEQVMRMAVETYKASACKLHNVTFTFDRPIVESMMVEIEHRHKLNVLSRDRPEFLLYLGTPVGQLGLHVQTVADKVDEDVSRDAGGNLRPTAWRTGDLP